ncbi:GntR family transcriptional regulator [Dactylosporangium darangshiense]|uniref:GntR family transcriptional regulator n=2 Tax=Dactylosporangium darangshiense TaxID=579108 RepID=A0ABP8DJP5_9ACTN
MRYKRKMTSAVDSGVPSHGRIPKHYAVKAQLLSLLAELGVGALLPAERELAARYGVARSTVRLAIQELTVEGRLNAYRGRGTFVAPPKLIQPLGLVSYTEAVREQGRRPGRRVVTVETRAPGPGLAADLRIDPQTHVLHLERVLLADDEPLGLESTYLPVSRFPDLLDGFDPTTSLYRHVGERYNLVYTEARERIETVLATPRDAHLLETNPSTPMLLIQRLSVDQRGEPIEWVRSLYRGDRIGFETVLRVD